MAFLRQRSQRLRTVEGRPPLENAEQPLGSVALGFLFATCCTALYIHLTSLGLLATWTTKVKLLQKAVGS